jgi:hypothetical protein
MRPTSGEPIAMQDSVSGHPPVSASAAAALTDGLLQDRQTARNLQTFLKPTDKEYREKQEEIDGIDDQLRELIKTNSAPTRRSSKKLKRTARRKKIISKSRERHRWKPEVAQRRAIVAQNLLLEARNVCPLFDGECCVRPKRIREYASWEDAYMNGDADTRHAIDALISRDRKAIKGTTF